MKMTSRAVHPWSSWSGKGGHGREAPFQQAQGKARNVKDLVASFKAAILLVDKQTDIDDGNDDIMVTLKAFWCQSSKSCWRPSRQSQLLKMRVRWFSPRILWKHEKWQENSLLGLTIKSRMRWFCHIWPMSMPLHRRFITCLMNMPQILDTLLVQILYLCSPVEWGNKVLHEYKEATLWGLKSRSNNGTNQNKKCVLSSQQ